MPSSSTPWALDHVVIIVEDLATAVADFEALGFRVELGGRNGPVHNALIYLSDGTYIELTCPVSKVTRGLFRILHRLRLLALLEWTRPGLMHRFYAWFGGPVGLQDWCVRVVDLDGCRQDAVAGGVQMAEARPFRRTRPDGAVAEWRLVAPTRRAEPFWIEDVSAVEVRVPWRDCCVHPNGAEGIRAVVVRSAPSVSMQGVSYRVADDVPAHRLRLEVRCSGDKKGVLPLHQTSNAWIELV